MDGWQLIRSVRKDSRFKGVPVVVMSSVAKREVPEGAACWIDKNVLLGKMETPDAHRGHADLSGTPA